MEYSYKFRIYPNTEQQTLILGSSTTIFSPNVLPNTRQQVKHLHGFSRTRHSLF